MYTFQQFYQFLIFEEDGTFETDDTKNLNNVLDNFYVKKTVTMHLLFQCF